MHPRTPYAALLAVLLLGACDTPDWPPFRGELEDLFERTQSALTALETTMEADGIPRMNTSVLQGDVALPGLPSLDLDQARKYRDLLNGAEVAMTVVRGRNVTEFEMLSEPVGTQLYIFSFVHRRAGEIPEDCDGPVSKLACGTCSIELDDDWSLEYEWFPQDLDVEAEQCSGL